MFHNTEKYLPHFKDIECNEVLLSCDFVCLAETWLRDGNELSSNVLLKSFKEPFLACRKQYTAEGKLKEGGGVAIFQKKKPLLRTSRMLRFSSEFENSIVLWNNIAMICVYIPPDASVLTFRIEIDRILTAVSQECPRIILFGDFNDDIMGTSSKKHIKDYIESRPYVALKICNPDKTPTTTGGSCIDHVYCTTDLLNISVSVLPIYYSYHEMVHIIIRDILL